MRKIMLAELKEIALASKSKLWEAAHSVGRDIKIYAHWSAGHYNQPFPEYHINIDQDGSIYISTDNLADVLAHTWHRNSGAVGIALECCYKATTNNLGSEPPTDLQIESMSQVIAVLCHALNLTINKKHVLTHGEAADLDGYGIDDTDPDMRWDLHILHTGDEMRSGGNILRGKANFYLAQVV
ncbi:MAG: hypothetical protein H6Q69_1531 [Firmicutes bacterium]|nr:hypothetical protein [Bacillota bacterium]